MRKYLIPIIALFVSTTVNAQSIWDIDHLSKVKTQLDSPMYSEAYHALLNDADSLLDIVPLTVMMKEKPAPGSSDYTTNPETIRDRNRLEATAKRIGTLAVAYYFSDDERYAAKATELLKVWFLDKSTRMDPDFEYAQMISGVNGNKGCSTGVLEGYPFVEMLDGVALLSGSKSWTKKHDRELKKWMDSLLSGILTSEQSIEESKQTDDYSTAYDAQAIAIAMYVGRNDVARKIINEVPAKRIFTQIDPDGRQLHEKSGALSSGYSQCNLTHLIDIFLMAQKLGIKIDNATDKEGRNFYKALDFIASHLGKPGNECTGKQIDELESEQQNVIHDLWRVAYIIDPTRTDYMDAYQKYRIFNPSERFTLLYYTPDETDNAFASAANSLKYAMKRVNEERNKEANACKRRVSPHTINKDGTLRLVHPRGWTSGFFPGELWMMYEFTNDPYWREQAVSYTWPIEEAKLYRGTHDLGFMIGNSFGKAWELTGEKSYFDVVHQAAKTLSTRFNPTVGAIRSWDHNTQTWKYPVIIDNMMNLEMLFKMSEATGNSKFREIAVSHANVTLKNHFRDDRSSYHVVDYDPATGNVRMKVTAQGYADDSFWSRGQGWGLYGYTMCYRYTGDKRYLDQAQGIADWFLNLPNLPSDLVPYWDMKAPGTDHKDNNEVTRDASAASIIASSLYELALYVDDERAENYRNAADKILASLSRNYTISPEEGEGFLLSHSTGHHPAGVEVDVPLVYADYYYLEAMMRKRDVKKYLKGCLNSNHIKY